MPYTFRSGMREPVNIANFTATECLLGLCIQSIRASVSDGKYTEEVLATSDNFTATPPRWGPEFSIDPVANLSFSFGNNSHIRWYGWKERLETSVYTQDGRSGFGQSAAATLGPALFSANYTAKDCGSQNEDTYSCTIRGFAKSLTKTLRDFGVDKYGQGGDGNYLVKGEALIPATFVRVQWQWILLPAAVWVSGFVTWAAIAFQTWRLRLPKWRDDLLPLMFLYRGEGALRGNP